ncbi:hypothetical protein QEZ54_00255 [Catellatospora sp. KI3]|uniref:hypothetical protein n=1 Tax=Catellatospora sp. KI3 TaxID=3041620 RepID=UPI0024824D10|nr:hypothetical protein [Catellatospora sp. KI3]MDI1459388.1 hypothetical protein [Catellatospora sp. KI3]
MVERRSFRHESDVLLRQLDGHLARLQAGEPQSSHEIALFERIAAHLRQLIRETVRASAVDRARVRAAVHYVVMRGRDARHARPAHVDVWVVNDIIRDLGRLDLLIPEPALS